MAPRGGTTKSVCVWVQLSALCVLYCLCYGHKAEDADRWGTRKLGVRPGNGAPLRAGVASFFLLCERGLNSHTVVATRPHLSLAF